MCGESVMVVCLEKEYIRIYALSSWPAISCILWIFIWLSSPPDNKMSLLQSMLNTFLEPFPWDKVYRAPLARISHTLIRPSYDPLASMYDDDGDHETEVTQF